MEQRKKGLLVAFDGIDGCGKSTQVRLAFEALERRGIPCILTREPGGTFIGEKIRKLLLDKENAVMSHMCETFLYFAARAQHVAEKVAPAIEQGMVVLCDRFIDSTMAYQGYGRGITIDTLLQLHRYAAENIMPDVSFVFDIPVEEAFRRMRSVGRSPDRLEESGREFLMAVRDGYLELARRWPERIRLMDGIEPPDYLTELTVKEICRLYSTAVSSTQKVAE